MIRDLPLKRSQVLSLPCRSSVSRSRAVPPTRPPSHLFATTSPRCVVAPAIFTRSTGRRLCCVCAALHSPSCTACLAKRLNKEAESTSTRSDRASSHNNRRPCYKLCCTVLHTRLLPEHLNAIYRSLWPIVNMRPTLSVTEHRYM